MSKQPENSNINFAKYDGKLTLAEAQCFERAQYWQRKSLQRQLIQGFTPKMWFKFLYRTHTRSSIILLTIVSSPLIVAYHLAKAVILLLAYPFRRLKLSIVPANIHGAGERNLKGIHNAFHQHINLPADYYIACVNDWIEILFGKQALESHRMEHHLDMERVLNKDFPDYLSGHTRNVVYMARDSISDILGHFNG